MSCEATLKHVFSTKEVAEKKLKERKISLLLLIQHFFKAEGYIESYHQLSIESKLPKDYEICDNIELSHILQEFETYYFIRFQKYPKIFKKVESDEKKSALKTKKKVLKVVPSAPPPSEKANSLDAPSLVVVPLTADSAEKTSCIGYSIEKIFKPLGSFEGYSDEWKSLANIIVQEIVEENLNVKWTDIVGLDKAKELLREAVVYPVKYPTLYEGFISPWKGLLLFGPSGTGKTMLARAVATECRTTFFNISASSIISKWRGDSEKLIKVMFDLARLQAPSTIFIDELDAIASQRDSNREHEASRRLKSELLIQLDGLCQGSEHVFFLTTSNLPWDLDMAILRRLEKRIIVDLPDLNAREQLIHNYLPPINKTQPHVTAQLDYLECAEKCEGYSAFDIKLLCKEISMNVMRVTIKELEKNSGTKTCHSKSIIQVIVPSDFEIALEKVKPTAVLSLKKYKLWEKEFGSY